MDDKRTLVAFLIIGVIIVLMPYYLEWLGVSKPVSRPPVVAKDSLAVNVNSKVTVPLDPVISPETSVPGSQDSTRASFTPRDLVVTTPLQLLTFSTAGGILTSAKLPKFTKASSNPMGGARSLVELVPEGGRGFVLTINQGDQTTDLSSTEFVPDNEGIALQVGEQATLRMVAHLPGNKSIEKVFRFNADRYGIETEINYTGFGEDTEAFLGWEGGIARTEKSEETDVSDMRAVAFMNEDLTERTLKADENETKWDDKGLVKLLGVRNKYFLTALSPLSEGQFKAAILGNHTGLTGPNFTYRLGSYLGRLGQWKNLFYLGPLDYEELSSYKKELERSMNLGWPVIRQLSALLMAIFVATFKFIPNYGWVIVLFATAIKALVYPLSQKSFESASKMQQLQPKLVALKERFKSDPQRLSRETMKLYQEEGINPLGGCLPMVLQMPIFFSLYNVFSNTIELRQAPFLLWIQDLSVPDEVLVGGLGLHVLPLLMAVSMFFQQKMTMKDPKQAALVYLMPVMMVFIFWKLSSGLVLYWTVFNILSIAQQALTVRFRTNS